MDSDRSFEVRAIRVDELGRLSELIDLFYNYQFDKSCSARHPNKEQLLEELSHRDEESNELKANKFCTRVIVSVDLNRLNEPNQAYVFGYMIYSCGYSIISGRCLYMTSFFIDEDYRRRGVGGKFIEYLRLHGRVMGTLQLDVPYMNANQKGISFYATYGSYPCNQDYMLMKKKIL